MNHAEKIFSYAKEKIFLINKRLGTFVEFNEGFRDKKDEAFDFSKTSDLLIFKISQKIYKKVDLSIMQEMWNIISSEINIYSFEEFSMNLMFPNQEIDNQLIKILKISDKNLNFIRRTDNKLVFSLETEEEIVGVYSWHKQGAYFKNSLITNFHFLEQDLVLNYKINNVF